MDTQEKRQTISKKLNEYTSQITPGQMGRLSRNEIKQAFNVFLGRDPYMGGIGKVDEYAVYENHPDDKVLRKDLSVLKKRQESMLQPIQDVGKSINLGQGGPSNDYASSLAQGATNISQKLFSATSPTPQTPSPSMEYPNLSLPTSGKGFRTDRHNNPTAMTTDVAANGGLKQGVDYLVGDPFQGGDGRTYYTARLLGDPIKTTIKAINNMGFYTQGGKPRWTYTAKIPAINNWGQLTDTQKAQVISQMARFEGSSKFTGSGGPKDLGRVTTNFGDQTRDTNFHQGVDIANAEGTPIPKMTKTSGQVTQVGQNGDYGNQVVIQNDDGTTESYGHLQMPNVQVGQKVAPNQVVGAMGKTGNTWSASGGDPSHLHLEISDMYGRLINPIKYF
jgi:hypothetical protein